MTEKLIYQSRNSQVYLLEESEWEFPVIRKTLNSEYPPPGEIARFYNEFDVVSGFSGEGTRRVLKRTRYKRKHALYLEYIDATTLEEAFKGKQHDIVDFLHLAIAIARAIGDIHRHHIIHKDISAQNILVDPDKRAATIIDFGISSKLDLKTPHLGNPERLEGNLHYISPEQTGRMNRIVDYRSDLYSMGVVFYRMLAGRFPFEALDAMEMVHAHLALKPRPLCEVNDRVPQVVSDIVDRLLKKNADDRYQSADGVVHDLGECLTRYTATGKITPFPLAGNDHPGRFILSQKLYGREREVAMLLEAFDQACEGRSVMVLVAGYSGTGKSALVHEIHKPITGRRGHFIEGKFDQFQRGVPYFAIGQAFRDYVDLLLTEPEDRLADWRELIQGAVGREGRVLIDVIPNLVHVIGEQQAVPKVGGTEAQHRFNYVFTRFIAAIATAEHPIALFIDDLQWADSASVQLLKVMMGDPSSGHFLCIGAYRDNEVSPSHPFMIALAEMREAGVDARTIHIHNLREPDVQTMISESVSRPAAEVEALTRLVYGKTAGNAFFVTQFLKTLYQDALLHFHPGDRQWQWDLEKIRELDITDNVVAFMTGKIRRLADATREAMKRAACIGNSFDIHTVAVVSDADVDSIGRALHDALAGGFLTPFGNLLKFSHDRIQQAVYALIPETDRQQLHLTIGRLLLDNTPEERQDAVLFDIVNQWNSAREIIDAPAERLRLSTLNLRAGLKAKQASAFRPAYQYLDTGITLLPANHWRDHYDLSRDLFTNAAETAYLNGDFEAMDAKIDSVLDNAGELLDKVVPYEIRILAFKAQNRLLDAINTGVEVLHQLGEDFPSSPTTAHVVVDLVKTRARLAGKDVERLAGLPDMTEPRKIAAMRIIADIASSSYWATPALFPLLIFRMCKLSLRYGNTSLSAFGFATYGVILCGVLGAMKRGYAFGRLGLLLLDRFESREWLTQVYTPIYALINNWNEHVENTLNPLQESYHIGLETGAIEFACINANIYCIHAYLTGRALDKVEAEARAYSESFDQYRQETNFNYNEVYRQGMLNFMGRSENPLILKGEAYDEEKMAAQNRERNDQTGTFFIHFNKLILCCFFQDYERANQHAGQARALLEAVLAKFEIPNHHFYEALSLLAVYRGADRWARARIMKRVRDNLRKLAKWARDAPENYQHKYHLVEAERLRVLGKDDLARVEYDRAIEGAARNRYIHEEALAYETAGRFYSQRKSEGLADYHIKAAYSAYREWGAEAKLRHLEERYPENISRSRGSFASLGVAASLHGVSTVAERSMLDLTTVLKASTAISGEIVLRNLLRTLMKFVIENAGAQRGVLLLDSEGELLVQASYDTEAADVDVLQGTPVHSAGVVAESVVQYVSHTHESVVVNNAQYDERHAQDPYIVRNRPQSILGMPILNKGAFVGMLYLENNLTAGAFTSNRIDLLTLMAGQIAVSIENAMLYENLEQRVRERTEELNQEKQKSDELLLNILPAETAGELKRTGKATPRAHRDVTVMFTDFRNFTRIAEHLSAQDLVREIDTCFGAFDEIMARFGIEKIKTIGDAYMCVGGLPVASPTHAVDTVNAALAIQHWMAAYRAEREAVGRPYFEVRIGLHSGALVSGVVGTRKFAYDIWGETVNIASRMEAGSEAGRVNVSGATYARIKDHFRCTYRGRLPAKNVGEIEMYFVEGLNKPHMRAENE